jgi:hypothetical protein
MIITIDTCDNGCVVSYNNSVGVPMMTTANQVRVIKTDSEAVAEVETILSNLRTAS